MKKPRIKIIQYMHGDFEYFAWSERINRRYCELHGYDYIVRRDEPRTDRHICWHKVPIILDELRDCDYLLYLDADAVFYSQELTLENELIPELCEKSILMTQDCGCEAHRWSPGMPSSGVILMKNDELVMEIITKWDQVSEIDEETRWTWPPEQLAFRRHIFPKFKDNIHIILDYYTVQGRFGQFIRHFYLSSDGVRTNVMKAVHERLTTPSQSSMKPMIKVVQYHWGEQNRSYQITRLINEMYCRRHGYEYVLKTFIPREDRSLHWTKIPAMREELHDCDFLLFLDADAFFYSQELTIEEELIPAFEEKLIMMSADCINESGRYQPHKPNSGAVLVRNTEKSAEILRVWDESSERPGLEHYRFNLFHEQETCFQTIWQEYAGDVKQLADYYLMNGYRGMFIRHIMGVSDEIRRRELRKFLTNREGMSQILEELEKLDF
ncbi:MAG: putative nucleotide-diphospho-sugar transferase [Planctomycetaceae bacterium]|nr:putative nucleotide-diphospho-sugar transferase [Planctomycetaceae bacterium]